MHRYSLRRSMYHTNIHTYMYRNNKYENGSITYSHLPTAMADPVRAMLFTIAISPKKSPLHIHTYIHAYIHLRVVKSDKKIERYILARYLDRSIEIIHACMQACKNNTLTSLHTYIIHKYVHRWGNGKFEWPDLLSDPSSTGRTILCFRSVHSL